MLSDKELMQLKKRIEAAEREMSEAQGALKQLEKDLKGLGFNSVEEAEAALKDLSDQLAELEESLEQQYSEIEEMLSELEN